MRASLATSEGEDLASFSRVIGHTSSKGCVQFSCLFTQRRRRGILGSSPLQSARSRTPPDLTARQMFALATEPARSRRACALHGSGEKFRTALPNTYERAGPRSTSLGYYHDFLTYYVVEK